MAIFALNRRAAAPWSRTTVGVPNSIFARAVRKHALEGLRDNVAALVKRIQAERAGEQALLQQQVAALRTALN